MTIRRIPTIEPGDLPDSTQLPLYTRNQPGLHELFAELRALVDGYRGERVLLGEFYVPIDELVMFYGDRSAGAAFALESLVTWSKWQADAIGRRSTATIKRALPAEAGRRRRSTRTINRASSMRAPASSRRGSPRCCC